MRLVDSDIEHYLDIGKLWISPRPDPNNISGISVDLKLGKHIMDPSTGDVVNIEDDGLWLEPNNGTGLVLGETIEKISLPDDIVGWFDGRSCLARKGIFVHITAGRIDPGFEGKIVLEIINMGPERVRLGYGELVATINFEKLHTSCTKPYNSKPFAKYRNQSFT